MHLACEGALLADGQMPVWLYNTYLIIKVLIGFSLIIFVHEAGHFLAAKWCGVRVDRFAVGFGPRLFGYRGGEGFTFGNRPEYTADELTRKQYGETDYCFKALPIGGYVKMLGEGDVIVDEQTGEMRLSDDPRAFPNRPVSHRMIVVSAGVVFNLLFAALLMMAVFMIGMKVSAPIVGFIPTGSEAQGKLEPGDRILAVNNWPVYSYDDVMLKSLITDEPLALKIERGGRELPEPVYVKTERVPGINLTVLNVKPQLQAVFDNSVVTEDDTQVQKNDRIVAVNGRPLSAQRELSRLLLYSNGDSITCALERPHERGGATEELTAQIAPSPRVLPRLTPELAAGTAQVGVMDDLLGLQRFQSVGSVIESNPAEKAGFQPGDVIIVWGNVANPRYDEIVDNITANADQPVPVLVDRGGEEVKLEVVPRMPGGAFASGTPKVGIQFDTAFVDRVPRVADVTPDSPAAALNLPRGSVIRAINGKPVDTWRDVILEFWAAAGSAATITYQTGDDQFEGRMDIPSSVVNELGLPPGARVTAINGASEFEIPLGADGDLSPVELPADGFVLERLLDPFVGETVKISYRSAPDAPDQTAEFVVREDNRDAWQLRIVYTIPHLGADPEQTLVQTGNPLTALKMGGLRVVSWVERTYAMLKALVVRNDVGVEHVSGPVGIVERAVEQARMGLSQLLYFLAFLSVNLAVINFLPIPVMDGGLMVFLLIEKIKGKPLSLKAQMISTLVGLAAIILIAVFVTIQDISKLFQ